MLNKVELPSQEAAWYLLRGPMAELSVLVEYNLIVLPDKRQRIKNIMQETAIMEDESTDILEGKLI